MKLVAKIVVVALAILLAAELVPGISVGGFGMALLVALVLGAINLIIRPVLLLLTLPITLITFGLFALVLNALLFWLAAFIVPDFSVDGFLAAFLGSLVVSVANFIIDRLLP